jgi:hypothetical protein
MTQIVNDCDKNGMNDKVIANCASTLGFLSAYSNDPSQMKALFNAFDESENDTILLPLKFSILANGNETLDKSELVSELESILVERLVDSAGFEEIDDDPSPIGGEDDDEDSVFRFQGSLDLLAYILDKYGRRDWC